MNQVSRALHLLVLLPSLAVASAQIPDEVVLDGSATPLFAEPLRARLSIAPNEGYLTIDFDPGQCSASWRGYRAFWKIEDGRLLLERVVTHPCSKTPKEVDLKRLSPSGTRPVEATWYSGVLVVPLGTAKLDQRSSSGSVYERYAVFVVQRGKVLSRTELDEPPQ